MSHIRAFKRYDIWSIQPGPSLQNVRARTSLVRRIGIRRYVVAPERTRSSEALVRRIRIRRYDLQSLH